jgi:glucosamine--fructose-6-phosphate aminotransferase (isomerizing)
MALCPQDSAYEKMISNIKEVEARGARIIAIGTEGDTRLPELASHFIGVPPSIEILNPVLCNIPQQLFAYYCALYRGCEIDKPRNLAKSVTVE